MNDDGKIHGIIIDSPDVRIVWLPPGRDDFVIAEVPINRLPADYYARKDLNDIITKLILPDGEDMPHVLEPSK